MHCHEDNTKFQVFKMVSNFTQAAEISDRRKIKTDKKKGKNPTYDQISLVLDFATEVGKFSLVSQPESDSPKPAPKKSR